MQPGWYFDVSHSNGTTMRWWNGAHWSAGAHPSWRADDAAKQAIVPATEVVTKYAKYEPVRLDRLFKPRKEIARSPTRAEYESVIAALRKRVQAAEREAYLARSAVRQAYQVLEDGAK